MRKYLFLFLILIVPLSTYADEPYVMPWLRVIGKAWINDIDLTDVAADSLNIDSGELIVSNTDDYVSVGHDLIVADSLSVNGDQFVISNEDNTVIINNTVADTDDPTVHFYYDADSDGSETSNGHLSINGTAAADPDDSYIEIDADDVGLGLVIDGNIGINTAPSSSHAIKTSGDIWASGASNIIGSNILVNNSIYKASLNNCNITPNVAANGGAYPWIYESGSTSKTGGSHSFFVDDSSAIDIDSTRHVVLYSESSGAGAQADAEWYLTQGDQMNFANASGYNFDTDVAIEDSLNVNAGDFIVSDNDAFVYIDDSLNVDTGTLIVSHTHEKVGINDATIDSTLTVAGGGHFTGGLLVDKTIEGATLTDGTASLTGGSLSGASLADGVTATTQAGSDNSTKVATTAYVDAAALTVPGTISQVLKSDGAGDMEASAVLSVNATMAMVDGILAVEDGAIYYTIISPQTDDGTHITASANDGSGNHNIIITSQDNYDADHDHETFSTDPTLFIHSATDPDTHNDEWISFTHDKTDGIIDVGSGAVEVDANLKMDYTGSNSSPVKAVYKKTITYDTRGSAQNIIQLPAGAVIWSIKVEVTTLFNGSGTDLLDIGVTGTGAHYKDDLDVSSAAWTTTMDGNIPERMTGSTQITAQYFDANSDANQGSADVYIEYTIH